MADIDFGLAYHFIDPDDGAPRQLRFRHTCGPDEPIVGELIAVIAQGARHDNGHTITLTRSDVALDTVETVLDGWQTWAAAGDARLINLAAIRRRLTAAGLV